MMAMETTEEKPKQAPADRMVHVTLQWRDKGEETYKADNHYDSVEMADAGLLDWFDKLGIDTAVVGYTSLNGKVVKARTWTRDALMERYKR